MAASLRSTRVSATWCAPTQRSSGTSLCVGTGACLSSSRSRLRVNGRRRRAPTALSAPSPRGSLLWVIRDLSLGHAQVRQGPNPGSGGAPKRDAIRSCGRCFQDGLLDQCSCQDEIGLREVLSEPSSTERGLTFQRGWSDRKWETAAKPPQPNALYGTSRWPTPIPATPRGQPI